MLPAGALLAAALTLLSWFRMPLPKTEGQAGASNTVVAALLTPSTVTTRLAEVFEPRSGTWKLICHPSCRAGSRAAIERYREHSCHQMGPIRVPREPPPVGQVEGGGIDNFTHHSVETGGGVGAAVTVKVTGWCHCRACDPPSMRILA